MKTNSKAKALQANEKKTLTPAKAGKTSKSTGSKANGSKPAASAKGKATPKQAKPSDKSKGSSIKNRTSPASKDNRSAARSSSSKMPSAEVKVRVDQQPAAQLNTTVTKVGDIMLVSGQLCTMQTCLSIAKVDWQRGAVSSSRKYVDANAWQYYVGINTWLGLILDIHSKYDPSLAPRVVYTLLEQLQREGLIAILHEANDYASHVLDQQPYRDSRLEYLFRGLSIKDMAQVARYLKRFTVLESDKLQSDGIKNWLLVEKDQQFFNRCSHSQNSRYQWYLKYIRSYLSEWFKDYLPISEQEIEPFTDGLDIPSGGTYLGLPEIGVEKRISAITAGCRSDRVHLDFPHSPWYVPGLPICTREPNNPTLVRKGSEYVNSVWGFKEGTVKRPYKGIKRFNRLIAVPKNFKTPRIVCPEEPRNQAFQKCIRDRMIQCVRNSQNIWLRSAVPVRDQRRNEILAKLGLKYDLATIDLSHASDSMTASLVLSAYSGSLGRDLQYWRPTHTDVTGGIHLLQQYATMGTGHTWLVMAYLLLACVCTACELVGVPADRMRFVSVFGDDIILPSEAVEMLIEILSTYGIVVNKEKSFWGSHPYRESCGAEWWKTGDSIEDIRSLYYPRFPISVKQGKPHLEATARQYDACSGCSNVTDTLSRFVELQKRLYYVSPHASDFLYQTIMILEPRMTASKAGTICNDCWAEADIAVRKDCAPVAKDRLTDSDGNSTLPLFDQGYGPEPVSIRYGHLTPVTVTDPARDPIVDEWDYFRFLRSGPSRVDDLLYKLAAYTTFPHTGQITKTRIKWVLVF